MSPSEVEEPHDGSEAGSNIAACDWFELNQCTPEFRELARRELKGLDLGCYCDLDQPCHSDILLRIANDNNEPKNGVAK